MNDQQTNKQTSMQTKKMALITGASGGIGEDLAKLCAKDGYNVVLVARSTTKLTELGQQLAKDYGTVVHVISADLAIADGPVRVVEELKRQGIEVDVLINNAGYALYGPFTETDLDGELKMIQLNVTSLMHLTKLLLPGMIARKDGKIMNVASTAAFQPGPLMAVYYASKAFVLSFSEALVNEIAGSGVTVTTLCPGPTKTGFQARAKMEESKLVRGKDIMDSATVAKIGYEAMLAGKAVVVPGAKNKIFAASVRFLPRSTVTKIVRSVQEKEHA